MVTSKLVAGGLAILAALSIAQPDADTVASRATISVPRATLRTQKGASVEILGVHDSVNNLDNYLGIPFAEPPIGNNRFRAPINYTWSETTYNASAFKKTCWQPGATALTADEDCLYLHIQVPAGHTGASNLPALIYLHGGSFELGDGNFLANAFVNASVAFNKPIVFVGVNYRTGPFGGGYGVPFLENDAANNQIKDVVASVKWVHDNIHAFGGDPSKITLLGSSAGSVAAALSQVVSDPAPIAGMILVSGSASANPLAPTRDGFPQVYPYLVNYTGCANASDKQPWSAAYNQSTFECLRNVSPALLNNATSELLTFGNFSLGFPFNPSVDYDYLPDRPHILLEQGRFRRAAVLAGDDNDEGTYFVSQSTNTTQQVIDQANWLEPVAIPTTVMKELLHLYPNDPALGSPYGTGNNTFGVGSQYKRIASIYGDIGFQSSRRWLLEQSNAHGFTSTWTWLFTGTPAGGGSPAEGTLHTSDIGYFLGLETPDTAGAERGQLSLVAPLQQYWLNFIYNQNPNGGSNPKWPAYHEAGSSANMLNISNTNTSYSLEIIQDNYRKEQIAYINAHPTAFGS